MRSETRDGLNSFSTHPALDSIPARELGDRSSIQSDERIGVGWIRGRRWGLFEDSRSVRLDDGSSLSDRRKVGDGRDVGDGEGNSLAGVEKFRQSRLTETSSVNIPWYW